METSNTVEIKEFISNQKMRACPLSFLKQKSHLEDRELLCLFPEDRCIVLSLGEERVDKGMKEK